MDWVEGPAQLVCVRGLILDSDYRILFQCLSDETRLKPECTIQGFWWSLQPTAPESAATNARLHCELSREDSLQNVCTIFEHLWTCSDLLHCNCSSNHRRFARPVTGIPWILSGFVLSNLETMLRYCQNHTTKKKGGKTILSGDVATLA